MVRAVAAAVLGELSHSLARAALDTVPRPWTVTTPADSIAEWKMLKDYLVRVLRARVPEPADSTRSHLRIETLRLRGDSLFAGFTIGGSWICPSGQTGGSATHYEVTAVRHQSHWQPARTRAVEFSDSMPCSWPP
jgi:hypothetical protein